jgi:hypothetical protein
MADIKELNEIIRDIQERNFQLTEHAFIRALERNLDIVKIIEYAESFEIIEDYPEDKYSHSSLLLCFCDGEPLHLQVTRSREMKLKVITIYIPDEEKWWDNFRRRK